MVDEHMDVVAAIITNGDRILVTKRKQGSFMAGLWEFPGGKVEAGEKPREALMREIKEELAIEIEIDELFYAKQHVYDLGTKKRQVKLFFYEARMTGGSIECMGCEEYRWVTKKELLDFQFVDGDTEVVEKLAE
jgi:8-oxo-dGTP diphosphatase